MNEEAYSLQIEKVYEKYNSSTRGLTEAEALKRFQSYGRNSLPETTPTSWPGLFLNQFQSPLIYILLGAAVLIYFMGETTDALIIMAVLVVNAVTGAIQEGRAENTLRALKKFVETKATVIRDGIEVIISDDAVVLGDLLVVREGEKVSADARLVFSQGLKSDEASFTGESEPVQKISEAINVSGLPPSDRKNIVFKGTHISAGNGRAVVYATGIKTVVGKIAKEIADIDTEIPLKANIRYLSNAIIFAVAGISAIIFLAGIISGHSTKEMFMTVISLAVSVIPEGLPIVITLVLASGVWRMSKHNALIKKLQAVEALGQARIIAVDKTGTITSNELVITEVWTQGKLFKVGGYGYEPKGDIYFGGNIVDAANHEELLEMGRLGALSSNARLSFSETEKKWQVAGDPTEAATLVFAVKTGFHREDLLSEMPFISEIPFDYRNKFHIVAHKSGESSLVAIAGAPEVVLAKCSNIGRFDTGRPIQEDDRTVIEKEFLRMSENGLRVIALAEQFSNSAIMNKDSLQPFSFVGLVGMKDELRPEVAGAMAKARGAWVRVIMITGDHAITAKAIAKEAGIFREGDSIITGQEIDGLDDKTLSEKLSSVSVFARVTPDHKLRIIQAFKNKGEIIAMTGDGVNDAPSLVAADLGVAMGRIGTEVAKTASDIVLLDDNFGSIVDAIEEGRSIYRTIKKVLLYLFSTSAGEVLTIASAIFLGLPLPLLASQIIWLNFVTDGFLTVALAMEPKEKDLLSGQFEKPKKYIIGAHSITRMTFMAVSMMVGTMILFITTYETDLVKAMTIALTVLAVFQWLNAWNCRSESESVFKQNPFTNMWLVLATLVTVSLQTLAVYNPFMQKILHTVPLNLSDWTIVIVVSLSIVVVEEIRKWLFRLRERRKRIKTV